MSTMVMSQEMEQKKPFDNGSGGDSCSAIPYHVYIFTLENGKPEVIWDFDTGDRADGGLRQSTRRTGNW